MLKTTLTLLAVLLIAPGAFADDGDEEGPPPKKGLEPDPVVVEVSDEKADEMLKALDAAGDEKTVDAMMTALEPFFTAAHEDFEKPLLKLAGHRSEVIRVAVTKALGSQPLSKKLGIALLNILMSRQNRKSPTVCAMAIQSMRRVRFENKRVMDELESVWRKRATLELMQAAARYFGDLKKVETVKLLIQWVEAPQPANVNSGSNPPASYWKRMWEIWDGVKEVVFWSLKNITGQEHRTENSWRIWLDSREAKELGIR